MSRQQACAWAPALDTLVFAVAASRFLLVLSGCAWSAVCSRASGKPPACGCGVRRALPRAAAPLRRCLRARKVRGVARRLWHARGPSAAHARPSALPAHEASVAPAAYARRRRAHSRQVSHADAAGRRPARHARSAIAIALWTLQAAARRGTRRRSSAKAAP
eukprot:1259265-Pleurochrysis_carterae.AAC.1